MDSIHQSFPSAMGASAVDSQVTASLEEWIHDIEMDDATAAASVMGDTEMSEAISAKRPRGDVKDITTPTPRKAGGFLSRMLEENSQIRDTMTPDQLQRFTDLTNRQINFFESHLGGLKQIGDSELLAEEKRRESEMEMMRERRDLETAMANRRYMERKRTCDSLHDTYVDAVNLVMFTPEKQSSMKRLKPTPSSTATAASPVARPPNRWEAQVESTGIPVFSVGTSQRKPRRVEFVKRSVTRHSAGWSTGSEK